jgi:hypothetical protein
LEDFSNLVEGQQRRRSAAKKNRMKGLFFTFHPDIGAGRHPYLTAECFYISRHPLLLPGVGIKVAVGAPCPAKRNM